MTGKQNSIRKNEIMVYMDDIWFNLSDPIPKAKENTWVNITVAYIPQEFQAAFIIFILAAMFRVLIMAGIECKKKDFNARIA